MGSEGGGLQCKVEWSGGWGRGEGEVGDNGARVLLMQTQHSTFLFAVIYFYFIFSFYTFSISHSCAIWM